MYRSFFEMERMPFVRDVPIQELYESPAMSEALGRLAYLMVGKHTYGRYLCIPNWGIGTEISSLSDCFWNRERLEQDYPELSKVDIISIVKALEALSSYVTL